MASYNSTRLFDRMMITLLASPKGRLAVAALLLFGLSACATVEEIGKDELSLETANRFYVNGRYDQAVEIYQKVVEEHPDTPLRKPALIGLGDALYKGKRFFEAPLYYERFVELYPLDPLTPRAIFYLGMCYYQDSFTPDRDQTNTGRAIRAFEGFLEVYPNHPLAPHAYRFKREMERKLVVADLEVARFYFRVNRNVSAIRRIQAFLEIHGKSDLADEALFMLGECFRREGAYTKAEKVFAVLAARYPDSTWNAEARKALAK